MHSTRRLTEGEIRAQMDLLNNPEQRRIAAVALAREEDKAMRPPCRNSLAAFEENERREQEINDKAIADLVAKDIAKGLPLESNISRKQDPTKAHETKVSHISHGNNIIKPDDSRSQQAKLKKLSPQVMESVLSLYLDDKELGRLSTSCVTLYTQTNKIRERRALMHCLQGTIFNCPSIVSSVLHSYPDFIFAKPEDYGIRNIICEHTWLEYLTAGKSIFGIAQKLRHVDVLKIMLPYYQKKLKDAEKRGDKPRITELENMWILRIPTEAEQVVLRNKYIRNLILPMIKALAADTTIQMRWVKNPGTKLDEAEIKNANENTLKALKALRDELFKPKAIDDGIDVDQFLIATYDAYDIYFNTFQNQQQRNAYEIWVAGLGQSLVDRGLAEKFCEHLSDVVLHNCTIHDRARSLHLRYDHRAFYRPHRDDHTGLGYSFACDVIGRPNLEELPSRPMMPVLLKKLYQAKAKECDKLTQRVQQRHGIYEKLSRFVMS